MKLDGLQSLVLSSEALSGFDVQIVTVNSRQAAYANLHQKIHPRLSESLNELGVKEFFSHQAQAIDYALRGHDVVVITGTNSGKTLCYNVPVLNSLLSEPNAHAIYLFPTKALAHDQLVKLDRLSPGPDVRCATYDGDTSKRSRGLIRAGANILLTNPDMLHAAILPSHEQWGRFLKSLRFIVLDEAHVYRGIFGTHVAYILRRLLRLCKWHGISPQIIACSGTIANAAEHFQLLTGREGQLVSDDHSGRSERSIVICAPKTAASPMTAAARLTADLAQNSVKTLTFARSRNSAELICQIARNRLASLGGEATSIDCYRGGYKPSERRKLESDFRKSRIRALTTTSAMELGVDIDDLDAVILSGFPGTVASFRQQLGRSGRNERPAIGVWFAREDPLELFHAIDPAKLVFGNVEPSFLNPRNRQITKSHLLCAAHERALSKCELESSVATVAEEMCEDRELEFRAGRFYYPAFDSPAHRIDIRGTGSGSVQLIDERGEVLSEIETWRATQFAHPGAIYLHRGESYLVTEIDFAQKKVLVERTEADYFTRSAIQSVVQETAEIATGQNDIKLLGVSIISSVAAYSKIEYDREVSIETIPLDLPPTTFETIAIHVPISICVEPEDLRGAVAAHSVEHALLNVAAALTGCDRNDIGSAWYAVHPRTGAPAVYCFDRVPGGSGVSESLFSMVFTWVDAATSLIASCGCAQGCPRCLFAPNCESSNQLLDKSLAITALDSMRIGKTLKLELS